MKALRRLVVAWFIAGLLLALLDRWLAEQLWILLVFAHWGYAIVGVLLLVATVAYARRDRRGTRRIIAGILAFCAVFPWIAPPLAALGDKWLFQHRFAQHRADYERIVTHLGTPTAGQAFSSGQSGDVAYEVQWGPPVRVLFPQRDVRIGGWEGVIYSATPIESTEKSNTPLKLFGFDVVACRPLGGNFQRCWFSDGT